MFRFMSGAGKVVGRWVPILPNGARKYPPRSVRQNKNIPKPKKKEK